MSLEDSIKGLNNDKKSNDKSKLEGSTGEPPYEQFEKCRHGEDYQCKWKDVNGCCIYETCVMDTIDPMRQDLWYTKCLICKRDFARKPEEMIVPFCDSCIQRMNKAEELPHKCIFCGRQINSPAKLMFSGICDDCADALRGLIMFYKSRGRRGWRHTV